MELHRLGLGALSTLVQGEGPAPGFCWEQQISLVFRLSACSEEHNSVEMG